MALIGLGDFRRLPPPVFLLAGARCINTFGFSLVMPYLAYHLTARSGVPMTMVGGIYSLAGVLGAAGQLVGGELSDRIGRRPVMVASLGLRALILAALGAALLGTPRLGVVATLVVTSSVLRSLFEPAAQAQAAALTSGELRTAAFGLQRVGVNLGWALGPALGGMLAGERFGALFFAAALTTLVAACGCALVPEAAEAARAPGSRLDGLTRPITALPGAVPRFRAVVSEALRLGGVPRPRAFAWFLGSTFLLSILTTQLFSTLSVYAMTRLEVATARFGLLYSINGAMVVLLQGWGVTVINRLGARHTLLVGPLCYSAGYLAIGLAHSLVPLAFAVALVTVGELLTEPSETVAAVELGDPARPGRSLGIFGLVSSLGNSLGPSVGALLYARAATRPLALWGIIAALGLVGAAGYRFVGPIPDGVPRERREPDPAAADAPPRRAR